MSVLLPSAVALLAGLSSLRASRTPLRLRAIWLMLGCGCLLWALLGATAWTVDLSSRDAPTWPIQSGLCLMVAAGLFGALAILRGQRGERENLIDALLIGVVSFAGATEFLVFPQRDGSTR